MKGTLKGGVHEACVTALVGTLYLYDAGMNLKNLFDLAVACPGLAGHCEDVAGAC